jgi:hypothetical protein
VRYTELSPTGLRTSGQTDWWLLLFLWLPDELSRTSTCLQQLKSPRNCYALRKLQKTQESHRRVQAAGTEACLKSRSA